MSESTKLSAQQLAQNFAVSTRQNIHMLPKRTTNTEATTIQFDLPKNRYLSNIAVRVKGIIKTAHATKTTITPTSVNFYKLLRRISLNLNTGFQPFVLSGEELFWYNMIANNSDTVVRQLFNTVNVGEYNVLPTEFTASVDGANTEFDMTFQLPLTLNGRDMPGIILLQNESTTVNLTFDIGLLSEAISAVAGATYSLVSLDITPSIETFSIPQNPNARPDLSVLKLVTGRSETINSAGQQIIKMSTGTVYRKIIMMIYDENGVPATNDFITSNIELVFNQADVNYSITPEMLRVMNEYNLNHQMPAGMFVFDFSQCGSFSNFGGSRDLIDTANLTEFWIRFNTSAGGKAYIVSECLTRLK